MNLGEYLQMCRVKCGISRYALAKAAGLNRQHIKNIETGKLLRPNFFAVARIATVLNVSLDEIYSAVSEPDDN